MHVSVQAAGFAPGEAWDVREVASTKTLPGHTTVGDDDVTCDLQHHCAECEDITWLVVPTLECFRGEIVAVTLAVDMPGRWPRVSKAKVRNLENTIERDENVRWLQIKMDITIVMDMLDALIEVSLSNLARVEQYIRMRFPRGSSRYGNHQVGSCSRQW